MAKFDDFDLDIVAVSKPAQTFPATFGCLTGQWLCPGTRPSTITCPCIFK
ncbi:lantibiotic nisin-A [Paenibacillus sp. NRS-1782]